MPLRRIMKSQPSELLAAKGLLHQDWEALTPCQRECTTRMGMAIQVEQEAYLTQHPELRAIVALYISNMTTSMRKKSDILQETSEFFLRNPEEMDSEIRKVLQLPPTGPYTKIDKPVMNYFDRDLERDLLQITNKHFAPEPWKIPTPKVYTPETLSSSFVSIITSDTTLPTPEPIPTPTPTVSEIMFNMISTTVDKAIFARVDEQIILYDTAYVELSKAVEEAMEIPVIEIKEDIAELFRVAYKRFQDNIMEKERIAAEIAWEKRMRKKMKRTVRRENNFKGYVTPPTPKSEISSHESYRRAPPRPCKCHPQIHYNRYAKDRFGIYLPVGQFPDKNVTVTPVLSIDTSDSVEEEENEADAKSGVTTFSGKSSLSKKTGVPSGKKVKIIKCTVSLKEACYRLISPLQLCSRQTEEIKRSNASPLLVKNILGRSHLSLKFQFN